MNVNALKIYLLTKPQMLQSYPKPLLQHTVVLYLSESTLFYYLNSTLTC